MGCFLTLSLMLGEGVIQKDRGAPLFLCYDIDLFLFFKRPGRANA